MDIDTFAALFIKDLSSLSGKRKGNISFAVKKNIAAIVDLNTYQGFSLMQILGVINNKLDSEDVSYKAFYSAVSRHNKQPNISPQSTSEVKGDARSSSFRANEKINDIQPKNNNPEQLSDDWLKLLKDHPVMKPETILKAISNGLTYEKAKAANEQGIIKFAEVVNKYCARKFT